MSGTGSLNIHILNPTFPLFRIFALAVRADQFIFLLLISRGICSRFTVEKYRKGANSAAYLLKLAQLTNGIWWGINFN